MGRQLNARFEAMSDRVRIDTPEGSAGKKPWRVLLVDDEPMFRRALRQVINGEADMEVIGEAGDGVAAVQAAIDQGPDVVVMDVSMPGMGGIEATRRLLEEASAPPKVLVLTGFDSNEMVLTALQAGASGFVSKGAPLHTLTDAVRIAAEGDSLVAPGPTRQLISSLAASQEESGGLLSQTLTRREREILELIAMGLSNAEISEKLSISHNTVRTHVSSLLVKLDLRDRVQMVIYAYEHRIVRPHP